MKETGIAILRWNSSHAGVDGRRGRPGAVKAKRGERATVSVDSFKTVKQEEATGDFPEGLSMQFSTYLEVTDSGTTPKVTQIYAEMRLCGRLHGRRAAPYSRQSHCAGIVFGVHAACLLISRSL